MSQAASPAGAIFVSYAREDAEPARRIAEALRGFGVEVWFDQNELRGGDAWDAKIRRQIRECALFLPVISAKTQERREGYFRREWNLAVDRTLDMSASAAFIVPVIIDDTRESEADVPEQFLRAQCTRLPQGRPTPQFVEQVTRLLQSPSGGGSRPAGRHSAAPAGRGGFPYLTAGLAMGLLAALGTVAFLMIRPAPKPETAVAAPGAMPAPAGPKPEFTASAPAADAKSIAVLPFVDMSQTKDQEYFSDGIAEELLNLLAKVPELHVAARTSAFSFKGKNVEIPEIAERLHVAHVLEGSVRKSGNKVRITAQLVRATDGFHLWSETYDREMTDIFSVQDEIAGAVVAQLKVALLGSAPKTRKFNPNAYALFLQGRQIQESGYLAGTAQAIALYKQALAIDPNLAAAWVGLAGCYGQQYSDSVLGGDETRRLVLEAGSKGLEIDPDLAAAHATVGQVQLNFEHNLAAAARSFEHALAVDPTSTDVLNLCYFLERILRRPGKMVALTEYIVARDPLNPTGYAHLATAYYYDRRPDDAITAARTALRLSPDRSQTHWLLGCVLMDKGLYADALEEMKLEPVESWRLDGLTMVYHRLGKEAQAKATMDEIIRKYEKDASWNIAYTYAQLGEADRAFEWLEKAVVYQDGGLMDTCGEPLFEPIHQDPRWLPFLRRLGVAPEQLATVKFELNLPGK